MTSKMFLGGVAVVAAIQAAAAANAMDDVRIYGPVADRMNACVANHVCATDPMYFAREFRYPAEPGAWQTEFWGKYMPCRSRSTRTTRRSRPRSPPP